MRHSFDVTRLRPPDVTPFDSSRLIVALFFMPPPPIHDCHVLMPFSRRRHSPSQKRAQDEKMRRGAR